MRPLLATIHLSALSHNLQIVKQHAPKAKVMAVVKANGYGHGLLNAAEGLKAADGFAVLGLNEAITLREAGFEQTILLLEGVFDASELMLASKHKLNVVVHSTTQLLMLEKAKLPIAIEVHLKMDSGMHRLGFEPQAFTEALERLQVCANVANITLMSHFATADDVRGIDAQLNVFNTSLYTSSHATTSAISLANSATILRFPKAHYDWVRPGIMLYGATPIAETKASQFNLRPAMTLSSEIISVQTIQSGESIGYGHRFTATKTTRVGIVACGYADGYPRHAGQFSTEALAHGAPIIVAGKPSQTLGRVSMDMLFCDVTHIPEANIGAPVELWGQKLPVDNVARACGTIGYELLCAVSSRVPFNVITQDI